MPVHSLERAICVQPCLAESQSKAACPAVLLRARLPKSDLQKSYRHAIDEFIRWYNRTVVLRYRTCEGNTCMYW
jgi:hypothetical protein